MNKKVLFRGCATAVITPFKESGEVDYRQLRAILEFQMLNKIDAIVVCGTTGEAPTLSDVEHQRVIDFAKGVVGDKLPLICGTGSNDTAHAVMMSRAAKANGADGLLLVTPYYNRATKEGLIKSFEKIADSVDIPMILYNVPSRTTVDIPFDVYEKLSYHPNIVGIKEAGNNIGKFAYIVSELGDKYSVYSGNDDNLLATLACGGSGIISVTSNILPEYLHTLCENWFNGNYDEAKEMFLRLCKLNNILFSEVNPIPIKAAMKMLGFSDGSVRLPLVEMTKDGKKKLRREMKNLDII